MSAKKRTAAGSSSKVKQFFTQLLSRLKKFFRNLLSKLKEFFRKKMVALKRNPQIIPMIMLVIAFLVFSFNLTTVSNTTAKIQGKGMGLSQFCIMLFSLLSMVCMLNAFPRRKKANIPMVVLLFVMVGIIIYCDFHYCAAINAALTREGSTIKPEDYILSARGILNTHVILMAVSAALVALLPVYSKLLRKVKTSINVEDNGKMENIELND